MSRGTLRTDREIAALISTVVHAPFHDLWRRHERDAWRPLRKALHEGLQAHGRAMGELDAPAGGERAATGAESAGDAGTAGCAAARYRRRVAAEVLGPLRTAVHDAGQAAKLEAALAETARQVAREVEQLPAMASVPVSDSALERQAGMGAWPGVKRGAARALRPLVWRREVHDVAVAEVARGHLGRVVLPDQLRAFRESQRRRAAWLAGLERAWAGWVPGVLDQETLREEAEGAEAEGAPACLDAAGRLDRRLRALAGGDSSPWGRRAGPQAELNEGILLATVSVAGTFAAVDADGDTAPRRDEEAAAAWDRWAAESAARLDLCAVLLDACDAVDGIRREMTASWKEAVQEIDAALSEVVACLDRGRARTERLVGDGAGLVEALHREQARTIDDIGRIEGALPGPERLLETLAGAVDKALRRLAETCGRMPEAVVVHRVPRADAGMRRAGGPGHVVAIREAALQAFDGLRAQRIRRSPVAVAEALGRVHAVVAELREVSAYGYEAAIAELSEAADPAAVEPAVMVVNGLSRAERKADVARGILLDAVAAAEARANLEIARGIEHLVQRSTADRLTARYLDARSHVAAEAARDHKRWRGRLTRVTGRFSAAWRSLRTRLWPVKRALGIGADLRSQAELRDRSLAFAEEIPAQLPVVYRRLFSFEPVTDPRLLAGREDAVNAVVAARDRWRTERTGSLMVVSPPGAGITSFLNITADRLRAEAPQVVRRTLRERVRSESSLAGRLGSWLGLGDTPDLDGLAGRVLEAPRGSLPCAAILEGAEHFHLRVPGGASLLERLLAFTARTRPRVFWVFSMTSSAWQLAGKRSPASLGDLQRIDLDGLTATELKQAVLARHRLSGLPLQYLEPRTGRNLLLARARGARGSRKHQRNIEADYFQKLHRASLGSIRLALFHWLRSADFRTTEGSLVVRPLEPLPPFAATLDVEQSFALKALLDHGTLTVPEYCEIVRVPQPRGRHLFHALCDLRVVEPAPGKADAPGQRNAPGPGQRNAPAEADAPGTPAPPDVREGSIRAETRYRVRPLVGGAVVAHLKSLNILH